MGGGRAIQPPPVEERWQREFVTERDFSSIATFEPEVRSLQGPDRRIRSPGAEREAAGLGLQCPRRGPLSGAGRGPYRDEGSGSQSGHQLASVQQGFLA